MAYSGPPQLLCEYYLSITITLVERFVISLIYLHSHKFLYPFPRVGFILLFLSCFFSLRSNYIRYTDYKGLPVMGWNAGDDTGNLFNYKRLVGSFPMIGFCEKFSKCSQFSNYSTCRSETVGMESIDSLPGNTGIIGKWFFRLEDSKGEQDAIQKCLRWFKVQPDPASYTDVVEPCPCTLRQAFFDERFQWTAPESQFTFCVYTRFPSAASRGRQCCYHTRFDDRFGALIVGYPDGGVIDRYHRLASRSLALKHQFSDVLGFKYCCVQSKICERFYRKRPSEGCEKYSAPEWSKLLLLLFFFSSEPLG